MRIAKTPITNRRGQTMYVRYEKPATEEIKGLAIIQHGYSGSMDQPHIVGMVRTFQKNGFSTLALDCTNCFNPSDGKIEDATIETHLHDLYDAIDWAKTQEWFTSPFAIAAHSLGGYTILDYAENHPEEISMIFPCCTVTNGSKLAEANEKNMPEGLFKKWKETGWLEIVSWDGSEKRGKRPFSWQTEMKDYDVIERAENLTMPVLMVVGTNDIPTPPEHHLDMYGEIPGDKKEMHIIPGADHNFLKPEHRRKMEEILDAWLKKHIS